LITGRDTSLAPVGVWNDHVFPPLMDRVLRTPEVNARRAKLCQGLHGRVLEIGFGTGLNLRHYPAAVTDILVVEPSASAMRLAEPRKDAVSANITHVGLTVRSSICRTDRWIAYCPATRCAPFRT
jgi:hypothetical protein